MPSGLNQILPRMRVTSDALRISALVVAGVTTGYFWRAAFEASPSDPSRLGAGQHRRADSEAPGSLDGQTEACCSHSSYRPELGGPHFQPVRASHRRDAVAERPADFSAQADPAAAGADLAAARSVASAGHADAARHDSDSDHAGPDDAGLTCEGACRGRDATAAGRHAAARSAASSHQGRRRWRRRHDNGHHGKAATATTARTSPGGAMGTRTMIIPGQRATAASRPALRVEN